MSSSKYFHHYSITSSSVFSYSCIFSLTNFYFRPSILSYFLLPILSLIKPLLTVLNFPARLFKLRLRRDTSLFAEDVVIESTRGPVDFDLDKVYSGTLEGM